MNTNSKKQTKTIKNNGKTFYTSLETYFYPEEKPEHLEKVLFFCENTTNPLIAIYFAKEEPENFYFGNRFEESYFAPGLYVVPEQYNGETKNVYHAIKNPGSWKKFSVLNDGVVSIKELKDTLDHVGHKHDDTNYRRGYNHGFLMCFEMFEDRTLSFSEKKYEKGCIFCDAIFFWRVCVSKTSQTPPPEFNAFFKEYDKTKSENPGIEYEEGIVKTILSMYKAKD